MSVSFIHSRVVLVTWLWRWRSCIVDVVYYGWFWCYGYFVGLKKNSIDVSHSSATGVVFDLLLLLRFKCMLCVLCVLTESCLWMMSPAYLLLVIRFYIWIVRCWCKKVWWCVNWCVCDRQCDCVVLIHNGIITSFLGVAVEHISDIWRLLRTIWSW